VVLKGLAHLEALESLNSSSEQKVRRFVEMLPKDAAESIKSDLLQIRRLFDDVHTEETDDGLGRIKTQFGLMLQPLLCLTLPSHLLPLYPLPSVPLPFLRSRLPLSPAEIKFGVFFR